MKIKSYFVIFIIVLRIQFYENQCLKNEGNIHWRRHFHVANKTLPIILDVSDSTSHRIVSHILKILLEDRLRYANVSFNSIPRLPLTDLLGRLASNSSQSPTPQAHVNLDVWQPPGFNVESWVNRGLLFDCGPLGPIVRRGIFAFTSTVESFFKIYRKSIDHWRIFKFPYDFWTYTELYEFLTKDNEWIPFQNYLQFGKAPIILVDQKEFAEPLSRIFNSMYGARQSPVIMVKNSKVIGSNLQKTLDAWKKHSEPVTLSSGDDFITTPSSRLTPKMAPPLFFYHWYPSTMTVTQHCHRVLFPDCYGVRQDALCHFEVNQLSKMVWVRLKSHARLAYNLVSDFRISQTDLVQLLGKVRSDRRPNDQELQTVACQWVQANRRLWVSWTKGWNERQKLVIPGLFALYGKWVPENMINDSKTAVYKVNKNYFQNTSYELVLDIRNLSCTEDIVLREYLNYSSLNKNHNPSIVLAYLAAVCSDSLESTLKVATFKRHVLVTSTADSPKFGNPHQYKYFYRTIPSMHIQMSLLLGIFREWNWKRIVIMRKDSMFFDPKFFKKNKIEIIEDFVVKETHLKFRNIYQFLKKIRDKKHGKIFLVEYFAEASREIMCAAYKLNMILENDFVWFLNPWMSRNWNQVATTNCTLEEIRKSTSKYFVLGYRNPIYREAYGQTKNSFDKSQPMPNYSENLVKYPFSYFTVQAIYKISRATQLLLKENPSALSILNSPDVAEKFVGLIATGGQSSKTNQRAGVRTSNGIGDWVLHVMLGTRIVPIFSWSFDNKINLENFNDTIEPPVMHNIGATGRKQLWNKRNNFQPPGDGSKPAAKGRECVVESLRTFFGSRMDCSTTIFITCGLAMVPLLLIIIGVFIFCICRLRKSQEEERARKPFEFMCEELSHLDLPADHVVINRIVGKGNFGIVYGGEAVQNNAWVLVAIKAISNDHDYQYKYDFLAEAKLMSNLSHENIVKLIGISLYPDTDMIYLIMEHVTGGDLKKFLIKRRVKAKEDPNNEKINPARLTKYARDIASGMLYLHKNRYLHRDIACRNCLIDPEFGIKVGDFGLAKKMKCDNKGGSWYYRFNGLGAMPIRWLPPESLQYGNYSIHTDVWSYGVTLYEIVTFGNFPFGGYEHEEVVDNVKRGRLTVANFLPDSFHQETVCKIIKRCCSYQPRSRYSSMKEILEIFDNNPECVKPSLTEDLCNTQPADYMASISNSDPEQSQSHKRLSCRSDSRASGRDSTLALSAATATMKMTESVPGPPIFKRSPRPTSAAPIDAAPTNVNRRFSGTDFFNAFVGIDDIPATSSYTTATNTQIVRSPSTEYVHLPTTATSRECKPSTEATTNHPPDPVQSQTGSHEINDFDQGYVTYKVTTNDPEQAGSGKHKELVPSDPPPLTPPAPTPGRPNHIDTDPVPISMTTTTKQSLSLDLSTDTGCSDLDSAIDKLSPVSPQPLLDNSSRLPGLPDNAYQVESQKQQQEQL